MNFQAKLTKIALRNDSLVCVGLDPEREKLPKHLLKKQDPIFAFNKEIIDATADLVCAYKPNIAFYESYGIDGLRSLKKTIEYLKGKYPEIPIILDAKRGDIATTSGKYAQEVFAMLGVDAVTVNPYLGYDALEPFLQWRDKGIIILCRTSNPGASDFQDLMVNGEPLYVKVAKRVVAWHKKYKNCLIVVGVTWPKELKKIRSVVGDEIIFLVPGIGTQRGKIESLKPGLNSSKMGLIITSSRSIMYASSNKDFAEVARQKTLELRNEINKIRH